MSRILIALGVAVAAGWGAWAWHCSEVDAAVSAAVSAEHDRLQSIAKKRLGDAAKRILAVEAQATKEKKESDRVQAELKASAAADADRARTERERLQLALSRAMRGGGAAPSQDAPTGSGVDGLGAVATALSECSGRYEAVAGVADQLSIQVTGLQAWVHTAARVCEADDQAGAPPTGP